MSRCEPLVAIINYHYCHPLTYRFKGLKGITPEQFEHQVKTLLQNFEIVTLSEILDPSWTPERPVAAITFDDGLKDQVLFALPVLKRLGVRATFFVSSGPYQECKLLHVHRVHLLQANLGVTNFKELFDRELAAYKGGINYEDPEALGIKRLYPYDTEEVRSFKTDLNYRIPYPIVDEILSRLVAKTVGNEHELVNEFYLSENDVERCLEAGLELGLHSHRHRVMSRLDSEHQRHEISECLEFCRQRFGLNRFAFSYPYGLPGSYDDRTVALVAAQREITAGFTLGRRLATPSDIEQRWEIPRLDNRDVFERDGSLYPTILTALGRFQSASLTE